MSEELTGLIRKRGALKARVTRFNKYLGDVKATIENLESQEPRDEKSLNNAIDQYRQELDLRLDQFEEILAEFTDIQNEIEPMTDYNEKQLDERESFAQEYFSVLASGKVLLNHFKGESEISQSPSVKSEASRQSAPSVRGSGVNQNVGIATAAISNNPLLGVKLPQIQLVKFNGSYETWLEFRDTFESLIHKNRDIGDIQRFHYLRASLEGSAKQIIESLEFTESNYASAWQLLCERFNNTVLLVNNHLKAIVNMKAISNESSVELRRMLDMVKKHLRALEALKIDVKNWDVLLIFLLSNKLDGGSLREWESQKATSGLPTLEGFYKFMQNRANLLETLETNIKVKPKDSSKVRTMVSNVTKQNVSSACEVCKENHRVPNCKRFQDFSVEKRFELVKTLGLCFNCLKGSHSSRECTSGSCRLCFKRHHSLIHFGNKNENKNNNSNYREVKDDANTKVDKNSGSLGGIREENRGHVEKRSQEKEEVSALSLEKSATMCLQNEGAVLLATAQIEVYDSEDKVFVCRVLLDNASQSCYITTRLSQKLGVKTKDVNLSVVGIGTVSTKISKQCQVKIGSRYESYQNTISCLVIPEITGNIPMACMNKRELEIPEYLKLADPSFDECAPVDMLLGASIFWSLIKFGQKSLGDNKPILQKTRLGWIISGPMGVPLACEKTMCNFTKTLDIQKQLEKFWELEEVPKELGVEDKECMDMFRSSLERDVEGRFVVEIPFKRDIEELGSSRETALNRFYRLEKRLAKNDKLREAYTKFMSDYENAGYMSRVVEQSKGQAEYFLPHHGVVNEDSSTTQLRVVFDGGCSSDTGVSLNDLQYVGPQLQEDLVSLLLRFRIHNIVVAADIAKMFLQVWVKKSQRSLQKIFWRLTPDSDILEFELNTVIFGCTSSPFLAVACLQELGHECVRQGEHLEAARVILEEFYVDNMLSGAKTISEAVELGKTVSEVLSKGGFHLRKWQSNSVKVLQELEGDNELNEVHFGEKEGMKTLGLYWSCGDDKLQYKIGKINIGKEVTKRSILSSIAHIFDPLGLLSASIIIPKLIIQKLWMLKLGWDQPVPPELRNEWLKFNQELGILLSLKVPRQVVGKDYSYLELHGFSDASTRAYGGCVYLRSVNSQGEVVVNLLCSKGKVAPVKTLTTPKLELCGALVLAKLVNKVMRSLKVKFDKVFLWSDSCVCLSWIKANSNQFQIFVANRVSQIQGLTKLEDWHYVSTKDNPADLVSRGILPSRLVENSLWFNGPDWLKEDPENWPIRKLELLNELPETKKSVKSLVVIERQSSDLFSRYSDLQKLKHVVGWSIRFKNNCDRAKEKITEEVLSVKEVENAFKVLIKVAQREIFSEEISKLKKGEKIKKGKLSNLSPFLDNFGLIRVGGRLHLSSLRYDQKHPIIISSKHELTRLVFVSEHKRLLHAGAQMLLSSVRERFWVIGGRNIARKTVHGCMTCFRAKPVQINPLMGNLPRNRVEPRPAFYTTGCDYAGPFFLKNKLGRGTTVYKCYVCVFVCFTSKAIHLEAVTDLTTEGFIATLRRFASRRGKPNEIFSDNAKTYVGARTELEELYKFLVANENTLKRSYANENIKWSFIPPLSPHFGGLWESGVKSFKYHLKRVMTNEKLTYEDFATVLCQVESILNSRPLTPLSSEPSDLEILTPGHFLIGRPLCAVPDPNLLDIRENRLSRFQKLQKMQQLFWREWSKTYLNELQKKTKWKSDEFQLKENTLVLLKEDNLPPMCWKIGRILSVHPGADGIARVATVKTATGQLKRSFSKLCPLPIEDEVPK